MEIIAFTKQNPEHKFKHSKEDSFKYSSGKDKILVAVADGITRDPIGIKELPDSNDVRAIKEVVKKYPKPSPAKRAADLFCVSFIKQLKNKKINISSIKNSFRYVNKKIEKLNKKNNPKPDYLENDFRACVGVGGAIKNNQLYYGFIADCGVCVFDNKGKLRFRTENEGPNSKGNIDKNVTKKYKTGFKFSEGRKIIRSRYRNNLLNPLSYGALTGEKQAIEYVRTGKFRLNNGDYILFYSDGMPPIIYSRKVNISKQFNNLENYVDKNLSKIDGCEGTMVAVKL